MAKHLLNKSDIAKIVGKSYRQTLKILRHEASEITGVPYMPNLAEAIAIKKHFQELGEDVTIDELFFEDVFPNENTTAF